MIFGKNLNLPNGCRCIRKMKYIIHNICGSDLRFVVQMTVNICRRTDVAVAEPFLDLLHRNIIGKQQRSAAVPEIVKANVPQTVSLQNLAEVLCYRIRTEDRSHSVHKDISIVFVVVAISADTPHGGCPTYRPSVPPALPAPAADNLRPACRSGHFSNSVS